MILTIPHFILCFILYKNKHISKDVDLCIKYLKKEKPSFTKIEDNYFEVLLIAEDHRNHLHYGVDPLAIIRCIYLRLTRKIVQGGSTIEQQLVRVLTGRYERTLRRKLREQVIAILIKKKIKDTDELGKAYLYCAYFGYAKVGFFNLLDSEKKDASELIARLKYPTKKNESPRQNKKIMMRRNHIDELLKKQKM